MILGASALVSSTSRAADSTEWIRPRVTSPEVSRGRCAIPPRHHGMAFNVPLNKQLGPVDPVVLNHVQTVAPPIGAVRMLIDPRQR